MAQRQGAVALTALDVAPITQNAQGAAAQPPLYFQEWHMHHKTAQPDVSSLQSYVGWGITVRMV